MYLHIQFSTRIYTERLIYVFVNTTLAMISMGHGHSHPMCLKLVLLGQNKTQKYINSVCYLHLISLGSYTIEHLGEIIISKVLFVVKYEICRQMKECMEFNVLQFSPACFQVHIHRNLYLWITYKNPCKGLLFRRIYFSSRSLELAWLQCHFDGVSTVLYLF